MVFNPPDWHEKCTVGHPVIHVLQHQWWLQAQALQKHGLTSSTRPLITHPAIPRPPGKLAQPVSVCEARKAAGT